MTKMSAKSKKNVGFVLKELERKNIDSFQLIEELFSKFFVDFFPFDVWSPFFALCFFALCFLPFI